MIHVLELPDQGDAHAWFAYDDEDFLRKVAASDDLHEREIFDAVSTRELLDDLGHSGSDVDARARFPALCALGDAHGWDTTLYRADHLLGRGVFRTELVSQRDALAAALAARNGLSCIYWNDTEAVAAFEGGDPRIAGQALWRTRRSLYDQLVALEVLADDC